MRKHLTLSVVLVLLSTVCLFAQEDPEVVASGSGIDWFSLAIGAGYLLGVFVLLPIVIYTNIKSGLFVAGIESSEQTRPFEKLTEEQKDMRAYAILENIEERLTPFESEEGEELLTITNGKQAKFVKHGLDYINKRLLTENEEISDQVADFSYVYEDRTERAFTGSNWIIGCSAALGILFFITGGISTFLFIHFLGLVFYILSSRTTMYGIEKRMAYFGSTGGVIGSIMSGLFLGNGTKYYLKHSDGSKTRDWETEGQMALIGLVILFVVAMVLGFFAAFLGVINFIINYSASFLLPFKNSDDDWYTKNFGQANRLAMA